MQEKYSKIICDYLRSRPLIKAAPLEQELGLPQSTIGQALGGSRDIPAKHIFPIICCLADYGLEIDGYQLNYDPTDRILTGRKWVENIETVEIEEKGGSSFEYIVKEYRMLATDFHDLL